MFRVTIAISIAFLAVVHCGLIRDPVPDERIVGGEIVSIEQYPHQIVLLVNQQFICGGFIVTKWWVITAAHCVPFIQPTSLSIRVGASQRDRDGALYQVTEAHIHDRYDSGTLEYDVALLKITQPLTLSPQVQPIALQPANAAPIADGELLRVSGYGETLVDGDDQTFLRAVSVPKVSLERCQQKYANYPFFPLTNSMLCAGFSEGGKDACSGDSGSALVDQAGVAVGIVSWGIGCAHPGYPGVYASVSAAAPWIQRTIAL